jgi:hypothetical protein
MQYIQGFDEDNSTIFAFFNFNINDKNLINANYSIFKELMITSYFNSLEEDKLKELPLVLLNSDPLIFEEKKK